MKSTNIILESKATYFLEYCILFYLPLYFMCMTLLELCKYFDSFLHIDNFPSDPSNNGLQVQNSAPAGKQIKKVAFAVDACQESIDKAISENADVLFVHHGLFWGHSIPVSNNHYNRLSSLIKNDVALYACHIPLDASKIVGNNYGLAFRLGLENLQDFGLWRGMDIGVKGEFTIPLSIEEICKKLFKNDEKPNIILDFGKEKIKTVAIISGGAGDDLEQAIADNVDLYITGELGHEQFHLAKENQISVIAGGHYNTETVGVSLVMEKLMQETDIQGVFIDAPTNM